MNYTHTLCYVLDKDQESVFLGLKKRGFGAHKWNGYGGKIRPDESAVGAALRELYEESGLMTGEDKLIMVAEIDFHYEGEGDLHRVAVFITKDYSGKPVETEEMKPDLFKKNKLPYAEMWESDRLWLEDIFEGKRIKGEIFFTKDNSVAEHKLESIGEWYS